MIRILIAFVASLLIAGIAMAATLDISAAPAARAGSKDKYIDVVSFSWAVPPDASVKRTGAGSVTIEIGPAQSDGDVDGRDFLVWQRSGSPIPSLTLTDSAGGKTVQYKLSRCFVKSWSTSGDADDRPTGGSGVISYESMTVIR
jgi:hypothetical protein